MVVKKLEINGFRNLNSFTASFAAEKNLIFGANGSGKTSVIEALFLLGFGKSFLPVRRGELVQFNAPGFFLSADVHGGSGENTVSASLEKSFSLRLNGESATLVEVGRYMYPLFFSHFSYGLVIDYAPYFRKLVDRFIYGVSSLYFHDVLRYTNTLKQKNSLLKNLGKAVDNSELHSWNLLLAEAGCKLVKKRMEFTDQLNRAIGDAYGCDLQMTYRPALLTHRIVSETTILDDLERMKNAEIKCRRTLIGPQRDRFELTVGGKKLHLFSSGEKKKFLIMLFMAFIELFRQSRGEYPVFLIDDYDAAMDERNLEHVLDHFPAMQVIATSVAGNARFATRLELKKEN